LGCWNGGWKFKKIGVLECWVEIKNNNLGCWNAGWKFL